ncbi:MAG: hypothetical protein FJX68_10325 [Alphaproteobacteria bacterium]|nr:hypothetical protein [Alphaproteobacteria bacterium]
MARRPRIKPAEWDAERLRLAHQAAGHLPFDWDLQTNRVAWLGDLDATLGFSDGLAMADAQSWQEQVAPDDRPQRGLALAQQIEAGC